MKTAHQVRQEFLDFFEQRGHVIVPSAPLVPDDPQLMFTNAGMVQFKDVFLGTGTRPYARATDTQKCLRVSGKHNDLDEVGYDTYHHTLFEMLGNWSFGDYFKKEAIGWAWELLVERWGLAPDRLYATVHGGDDALSLGADDEAAELWKRETGLDPAHVLHFGSKDNFWMMGDTGPCGPCSEIHIDLRPEAERGQTPGAQLVNADHPRVMEIWNLVFIQYNAQEDGTLTPLAAQHVDTGMGFERMVAVLQGKESNYQTDVFRPIMEHIREIRGHSEAEMNADLVPYRVLADHGRAMAFLLADGVVPGNEKQKYVLRMIMRRALRYGKKLGIDRPFLAEVGESVIGAMRDVFPELEENRATILRWAEQEEKLFNKTLDRGLDHFEERVRQLKNADETVFPGEEAFYLHDTLGFPREVTDDLAREHGLSVDHEAFRREMDKQRERSRGSKSIVGDRGQATDTVSVTPSGPPTEFKGYTELVIESKLTAKIEHEKYFIFKETPFYAESGGQVADIGTIDNRSRRGRGQVLHVKKNESDVFLHQVKVVEGEFEAGDLCALRVDADRREATQRNHTATHVLHAALHQVVGAHAKQAGSLVAPDELRFDFTHFSALTPEQIERIEDVANRAILADLAVDIRDDLSLKEAKAQGATALFTEDYQGKETVRMVSILARDGGVFSRELCGGTHVARTGEIGGFKILSEESVSAGVRRVKVATGHNLLTHLREREALLQRVADALETAPSDLINRLDSLLAEQRALKKQIEALQSAQVAQQVDHFLAQKETFDGVEAIVAQADFGGDALKQLADLLGDQLDVVLLGSAGEGRVQLVCKVSKDLTSRLKAGDVIKQLTAVVGGGGGGAPHFAQGGGSQPDKLPEALERGKELLRALAE